LLWAFCVSPVLPLSMAASALRHTCVVSGVVASPLLNVVALPLGLR